MFMPPTSHSVAIQESWPTKIGHVQTWPTKVGQPKKLANMYDTQQTFVGQLSWPTNVGQLLLVVCHRLKVRVRLSYGFEMNTDTRTRGHSFNDNYRVRSWRSDAINYYITYCQIADLKLLTEN